MRWHTPEPSREEGAAAVEFALVLVLFLTLVFGIIQYAFYFFQMQATTSAAREGARIAAVGVSDCTAFTDQVQAKVTSVPPTSVGVTLGYPDAGGATYPNKAVVTVTVPATIFGFPFVPIPSGNIVQVAKTQVEYTVVGQVRSCP